MDPRDSEVLALANWPRIDANDPGAAPAYAAQNRAVGATYEPGSTFKAVTVAGALEEDVVKPDSKFVLPPQIQVADRTIGESHARGYEELSTAQILAQSSNVGAITIGLRQGKQRFDKWVRRFGFGQPTGVDLPGEERGIVLPVDKYSGSSMGNLPIGQGIAVTPMQMAQAYAAIANGGILRQPQIVRRIAGERVPTPKGRRIISTKTAGAAADDARGRVRARAARRARSRSPATSSPARPAPRTRSTRRPASTRSRRTSRRSSASRPRSHPQLLIAVMVDEPHGAIYGGTVAAPAFGQIASFALPYLRIPPG